MKLAKSAIVGMFVLTMLVIPMVVGAQIQPGVTGMQAGVDLASSKTGLGTADPKDVIMNIINIIMGFLGIIAVIVILYGGFLWMTAMGNEDKVGKAKQLIIAGIIGLGIILAALAITNFVIKQFLQAMK